MGSGIPQKTSRSLLAGVATVFWLAMASSCGDGEAQLPSVQRSSQAFVPSAEAMRVLGFEDADDWAGAAQTSSMHSEGGSSLVLPVNGWTTTTSTPLETLGSVASTLSLDVLLPATTNWAKRAW